MNAKKQNRLSRNDRKQQILNVALQLSERFNYRDITCVQIAEKAGCTHGLVFRYFKSMTELRKAIMKTAIQQKNLKVILQGLACSDPSAQRAPKSLREKAAQQLSL